ncbi:MAG: LytTR family DNA-binding domain-containing protein [Cytophagales bacterium]|nr:LytTR family DNA-binding domain-containing protein [Cytophagales bacterium]
MNCIVIDDDPAYCELLSGIIGKIPNLTLVETYQDPISGLEGIRQEQPDLIFLDVEMPELNGFEMIETIPIEQRPMIILITSNKAYGPEAFEVEALDYLVKPLNIQKVLKAVGKARDKMTSSNAVSSIFIKVDSQLRNVPLSSINYIEAYGDFLKVHLADGMLLSSSSMKDVEKELPTNQFFRIHRSYIVRIDAIQNIEQNNLEIDDAALPIGQRRKKDLLELIKQI